MDPAGATTGPPPPTHVPVEHRLWGLDRRPLVLTIVVAAIIALLTVVIPMIDRAVAWDDPIVAGDVIDLGQGVTFVPPVGWELEAGIRTGDEPISGVSPTGATAVVADGGVTVRLEKSTFDGSAAALLDQVNRLRDRSGADDDKSFQVTGPRQTFTTDSGLTGVAEAYTSANGDGRLLAFTFEAGSKGTGLVATVVAAPDAYAQQSAAIEALLASIAVDGRAS